MPFNNEADPTLSHSPQEINYCHTPTGRVLNKDSRGSSNLHTVPQPITLTVEYVNNRLTLTWEKKCIIGIIRYIQTFVYKISNLDQDLRMSYNGEFATTGFMIIKLCWFFWALLVFWALPVFWALLVFWDLTTVNSWQLGFISRMSMCKEPHNGNRRRLMADRRKTVVTQYKITRMLQQFSIQSVNICWKPLQH